MTITAINGQSGAGMVHMHLAFPPCSATAARIVRMNRRCHELLAHPEPSPFYDHQLFELSFELRLLARHYIEGACLDLDAMGRNSREVAAGHRGSLVRTAQEKADVAQAKRASSAFSSLLARGGFCQAGVVAPPDSPGFGKNASIGRCTS